MASLHTIGELRQGAESAQTHMSIQSIMMAAMQDGQTVNAAALAYQMNGAAAMRTEHASRHLMLQQQLASGLALPINTAKPDKPETPDEAHKRLMPDLAAFSLPSQQQQQQQQQQQKPIKQQPQQQPQEPQPTGEETKQQQQPQ